MLSSKNSQKAFIQICLPICRLGTIGLNLHFVWKDKIVMWAQILETGFE